MLNDDADIPGLDRQLRLSTHNCETAHIASCSNPSVSNVPKQGRVSAGSKLTAHKLECEWRRPAANSLKCQQSLGRSWRERDWSAKKSLSDSFCKGTSHRWLGEVVKCCKQISQPSFLTRGSFAPGPNPDSLEPASKERRGCVTRWKILFFCNDIICRAFAMQVVDTAEIHCFHPQFSTHHICTHFAVSIRTSR